MTSKQADGEGEKSLFRVMVEKMVVASANISFHGIHGYLNRYGITEITVRFATRRFLPQIRNAVEGKGWVVDTANWEAGNELTFVRSGPGVALMEDELVQDLNVILAPVSNPILFLKPKSERCDYSRLPKWSIRERANPKMRESKSLGLVYGKRPGISLPPSLEVIPRNSTAKVIAEESFWSRSPSRAITSLWVISIIACLIAIGLGFWLASQVYSDSPSGTLEFARNAPIVGMLYWEDDLALLGFWLYVGALAIGAYLLGGAAIFVVRVGFWFKWKAIRAYKWIQSKMNLDTMPDLEPRSDPETQTEQSLPRYWSSLKQRVIEVVAALAALGLGFGVRSYIEYTLDLWRRSNSGGFVYIAIDIAFFAGLWLICGLWVASRKMTIRRYPRIALNIGAVAGVGLLLLKAPAWAYADGMGAAWLLDSFDWTSLLSLSANFLGVLVLAVIASTLVIWILRLSPSSIRLTLGAPALLVLLTQAFLTLGPAQQAGQSLLETGTATNARGDYPVPACLEPAQSAPVAKQAKMASIPSAVWILASKDGRIFVTDRSEDGRKLKVPGGIRSIPAAEYNVKVVRAATESKDSSGETCLRK